MPKPITDVALRSLKPGPEPYYLPDRRVPGLNWWVYPSGHKAAQMRFRDIGKITIAVYDPSATELTEEPRLEDIGAPHTLSATRLLAQKVIRERKRGRNPITDHRARQSRQRAELQALEVNSFATAVTAYVDDIRKTQRGWRWVARLLGLHCGDDGKPQVIKGGLVERWGDKSVTQLFSDQHETATAISEARRTAIPGIEPRNKGRSEARARDLDKALRALCKWLRKEHLVAHNPLRDLPRPENAVERERFLSDAELRWLLLAADEVDAPRVLNAPRPFRVLLYLLALTGCRLREISNVRREELSPDLSALNLPASRTKNGRAFSVPLPKAARELIASLLDTAPFVLSTTGGRSPISGFSKMKIRLDAAMRAIAKKEDPSAVIEPFRLHDIRRSVASGLQRLGVRHEVIERSLNHVSGKFGGVAGLYQRDPMTEDVRAALLRWSQHIDGLVSGRPAKVVQLPRKRGSR